MSATEQTSGTKLVTMTIIDDGTGELKIQFETGGYTGLYHGRELLRHALYNLDQQDWSEENIQSAYLTQGM